MKEKIEKFLNKKKKEINRIAELYPEEKSLLIDYDELEKYDHELAEELIQNPDEVIGAFEDTLSEMNIPTMVENPRFHVRFKNLPKEKGYSLMVRDITSDYIGKFMAVDGVVNRISDVLPKVSVARFYCNKCGESHDEPQPTRFLREPLFCKNCKRRDFRFVPEESEWTDVQRLQIQEPLELLEGGEEARQIEVWAEDDLTGKITAGDKIAETGIMRLLPPRKKGSVYYKFLDANFIEGIEKEFEELEISKKEEREIKKLSKDPKLHEKVINSIAPSIYGYREIKEAIALQLFGGRTGKKLPDGTTVRPDLHILLIGEPGVAKSRILQYITQIAPKSIYVTGKGTTGAGLTVAAERDEFAEGAWTLKAGALILAGGGIAAIDEFDKMSPEDRGSMHEALEQQCLHYHTVLTLADGSEVKIGDFVEHLMTENPNKLIKGKDCFILSTEDLSYGMLSTDWDGVYKTKINRVSKHVAPDHFIKIKVWNGREVVVTPEHPVFVLEDSQIITKRADELTENDWLPVPLKLPIQGKEQYFNVGQRDIWIERASQHIKVPVHNCPDFYKTVGYLLSEGSKELNRGKPIGVNFTNKDPILLNDFTGSMEKVFGLKPYKQARGDSYETRWMLRYISRELTEFMGKVCPTVLEKANKKEIPQILMKGSKGNIAILLSCMFEGDGHVSKKERTIRIGFATTSKQMAEQVQDLLLRFGIRSNLTEHKKCYKVSITGYDNISKFRYCIGFVTTEKNRVIDEYLRDKKPIRTVKDVIPNITSSVLSLLTKYEIKNCDTGYRLPQMKYDYTKKGCNISRRFLRKVVNKLEKRISAEDEVKLDFLRKMAFGSIGWEKIKHVEKIKNMSQKWTYDVTIEPNHTFISQNMVLHNTISVAKAGIVARFKANTSVLAASNPKFSRFDSYKPLAEQFDIPPTLLSRFDLIFPIKDILDKELDKEIADHMLKMHKTGEEMKELEPEIPADLFRKYIAYSRRNIHPVLSDDAAEKIKEYYVDLRSSGGETVKATPRQLEALVRLAEASAKIRLSDTVTVSDAERAIKLTDFVLREIAYDESTGQIDIDRIVTDHPKSTRDRIRLIESIIQELIKESEDGMVSGEDIIEEAKSRGIDRFRAEQILIELKTKGVIYEPRHGRYMLTEG